jgi:hypothetical protein
MNEVWLVWSLLQLPLILRELLFYLSSTVAAPRLLRTN